MHVDDTEMDEKCGSVYIRHQPEYRSETCKQGSVYARFQREIDSPVKLPVPVPVGAKRWMLVEYQTLDIEHSQSQWKVKNLRVIS